MQKQSESFFAETVDEQIDHLLHTEEHTPAGSVVRDLQGAYEQGDTPEQVHRSLDVIWSRLADRIAPENQTLFSTPETSPLRALRHDEQAQHLAPNRHQVLASQTSAREQTKRAQSAEGDLTALPARPVSGRASKRHLRRTLALSALAALVLLSVFSWALVTHLDSQVTNRLGSGPGTQIPTVPSTPTPQSMRAQAQSLLSQFHQEVTAWGQTHQYQDKANGQTYELDYAYDHQGLGNMLDQMLQQAKSSADYQAVIKQMQNALTNLHAMESNSTDQTPWNYVHNSDSSLLGHYQLTTGMVVVVSLLEQSMRVYQNGQLIKAFQVTSGRYEEPSLPGSWQIIQRVKNTALVSAYPKGSPNWYPPTPVQHLLGYHTGGYIICDSWWRENYGAGTNFPHHDGSGNPMSDDGASGSINLSTDAMLWLYDHVQLNTPVVVY